MKRALVLACGKPDRGDDGVALHVARALARGFCDKETVVRAQHQWLPEMAKDISEAALVIFVEATTRIPPGEISPRAVLACDSIPPAILRGNDRVPPLGPEGLLAQARDSYGHVPEEAYVVAIGVESFDSPDQLSDAARHAVPLALEQVKAILSGVSVPRPTALSQKAP